MFKFRARYSVCLHTSRALPSHLCHADRQPRGHSRMQGASTSRWQGSANASEIRTTAAKASRLVPQAAQTLVTPASAHDGGTMSAQFCSR